MKQIAFYPPGGGDPVYVSESMADYYKSIGWKRTNSARPSPAPKPKDDGKAANAD